MLRFLVIFWRSLNPEIVIGFLVATMFWTVVLGWQAAYTPTEVEKQECYEAAKKNGRKTEECKTLWERTTTDPVALFTLVLAFTTLGLWTATIGLYFAGKNAVQETRRIGEAQVRAYVSIKSAVIAFWGPFEHALVKFVPFNTGQSPARNFVWNVTVQYASGHDKQKSSFDKDWQNRAGIDIPASSDGFPGGAMVPNISLKNFREARDKSAPIGVVVRVKIDFRFTDVFERDWFGESYFHGIGPDSAPDPADCAAIGMPEKGYVLNPTAAPKDWE
jgi:hypothetical protein